jgi:hypothetical protein
MARTAVRLLGIALLLAAVFIASAPLRTQLAVDSCLDSGGSFDYAAGACDHQKTYLGERYTAPAYVAWAAAGVLAFAGGLLLVFSRRLSSGRGMRSNKSLERTREG